MDFKVGDLVTLIKKDDEDYDYPDSDIYHSYKYGVKYKVTKIYIDEWGQDRIDTECLETGKVNGWDEDKFKSAIDWDYILEIHEKVNK